MGTLPPAAVLRRALAERRVLIVCGSGGVGKTTTAASLGLAAALEGRRVLVCTIDPSRRLATSLGLVRLSDKPRLLDLKGLRPRGGGSMSAMVLDTKRTFDALVETYAGTPEARERILGNRFYRQVSQALAGSHEYMAMEKLLELSSDERFDLVILDTPPTRHALDFLEAPDRLTSFLDASVLRYFLRPYFVAGRLTLRVATRTGAAALRLADRYLGFQFLQDLSEFFLAFEGMYDGFKERAGEVHALLRRGDAGFVLVASPVSSALDEALYFYERLEQKKMPFVAFVVNRVHPLPSVVGRGKRTIPPVDGRLVEPLTGIFRDQQRIASLERRAVARLTVDSGAPLVLVRDLETDVHDLRSLNAFQEAVFA